MRSLVMRSLVMRSLVMRSFRGYGTSRHISRNIAPDQMRRLADLLIAGALLALTAPLMFFAALAIKWKGPGPIFERQRCIARDGRHFEMLKFRTMTPDSEHRMAAWTRKTTQIGKFIRYTRIECLPQLINVLRGEMSIVDPDGSSRSLLE